MPRYTRLTALRAQLAWAAYSRLGAPRIAAQKGWIDRWLRDTPLWPEGDSPRLTRPYLKHIWVHAAASTVAETAASVPLVLVRGEELVPDTHPQAKLFRSPNPDLTPQQFWTLVGLYMLLRGESLVIKDDLNESGTGTKELWPWDPARFKHIVSKDDGRLIGWEYSQPGTGQKIPFDRDEVLHFKFVNPYDPIRGASKMEVARMAADLDYKATKFNEKFFENAAEPAGVLEVPKALGDKQYKRMLDRWEDRHGGVGKAHTLALLEGGVSYKAVGITQKDAQFLEGRKMSREEICAVFHCPPGVVGILDYANYSNLIEQAKLLWTAAVIPLQDHLCDVLNSRFFLFEPGDSKGITARFDRSGVEALAEDLEKKLSSAEKLHRLGTPLAVINERLKLGLPEDIPGADVPYLPINLVPVNGGEPDNGKPPKPAREAIPDARAAIKRLEWLMQRGLLNCEEAEILPESTPKMRQLMAATGFSEEIPAQAQLTYEPAISEKVLRRVLWRPDFGWIHEARWRRFVQSFAPLEGRLKKALQEFFYAQRAALISRLMGSLAATYNDLAERVDAEQLEPEERAEAMAKLAELPFEKVASPDEIQRWILELAATDKELIALARPYFQEGLKIGAEQIIADLALEVLFDPGDPWAAAFMQSKVIKIVEVNERLRQEMIRGIRPLVVQAEAEGWSAEDLAKQIIDHIRGSFRKARLRSKVIARTEMGQCVNAGRFHQEQLAGIQFHMWSAALDERTRGTHLAENGNIVKVGEPFPVTGLVYPCDLSGVPEEVINCRCFAEPVPNEEGEYGGVPA